MSLRDVSVLTFSNIPRYYYFRSLNNAEFLSDILFSIKQTPYFVGLTCLAPPSPSNETQRYLHFLFFKMMRKHFKFFSKCY